LLEYFLSLFSFVSFFPTALPSSCALFHTFIYECDCTSLQCFYKGCIQWNQPLAVCWLMHSIHCNYVTSTWKKTSTRDFNKLCGIALKKNEGIEHSSGICLCIWKLTSEKYCHQSLEETGECVDSKASRTSYVAWFGENCLSLLQSFVCSITLQK
jgi:hypothetical protein